jgi:hypothetical protein
MLALDTGSGGNNARSRKELVRAESLPPSAIGKVGKRELGAALQQMETTRLRNENDQLKTPDFEAVRLNRRGIEL